jgi:hypothetical protein
LKSEEVPSGQLSRAGLSLVSSLISVFTYLKCHFHKISLGELRAILCLFKPFFDYKGRIRK